MLREKVIPDTSTNPPLLWRKGIRRNPPIPPISDIQPWEYTGNKLHPTEKAVSIIEPLIQSFSKSSDVVFDPFSGSRTTAVAAKLHQRHLIAMELDARYCEIDRKRLASIDYKIRTSA
ncbi:MAG: DNA methyltransferase [Cyanobacteria bacterium P01_H01_bin.74]